MVATWSPLGGGETGELVRTHAWASTPLGPLPSWSATMRCVTQMVLSCPIPMVAIWGQDGIVVYNDGYAEVCGPRHPAALGGRLLDIWPEAREFNARVIHAGLQGESLSFHAQELTLWRYGRPEQVWMDLEYTPILDDNGSALGMLATVLDVTERVLGEQAVRTSEEQLRAFVNATSEMLYRMSPDWRELRQLDGRGFLHDVERPTDDWIDTFIFEGDRDKVRGAVADAIRTKSRFEVETRVMDSDGNIGWSLSRAIPIMAPSGNIVEWFGAASDITDRKRAEITLAESEARFRGVFDSGVLGFSIFDANNGDTLAVNDRLLALTGHTRAEFESGQWDWRQFTPEEFLPLDAKAIQEARERGFWTAFEKEFIHKDGTRIPVRLSSAALPDQPGRVVGVVDDLSQERTAEAALRASEERLRLATDAAEIGYWDVDEVKELLDWPPRVKAMFGISADKPVTMTDFYNGLHPADRPRVTEAYAAAADPGRREVYDVEYRTVGKEDGILRWVAAKGRGVFDGEGRCLRVIGTAIDITARKATEAALAESEARLRALNESLEERIRERTLELERANDALRQSQKMQALGQLTGGIAHDFNNLLQAVTGSLNLIERRPDDPDRVRKLAAAASQAADRGAKLTGQLLAFSRAQKLELKWVELGPLLAGFQQMAERLVGPTVRLDMRMDDHGDQALCDGVQLEMALLNLVANARDAMPNGGLIQMVLTPRTIESDPELPTGDYIELSISDTGNGMTEDVVARAFEPFFTTKELGRGTGLGLSQVYGMAKQSGGTVRLESVPGKGTTVRLYLKRTSGKTSLSPDSSPKADGAAATLRVLVVDDDPDVRAFLEAALEILGHVCDVAEDGAAGLRAFEDRPPDLVILDFAMPVMNGAEVAQLLRARRSDIPIVFASGYSETEAINAVVGNDAVMLRKPFMVDDLEDAIRVALQRKMDKPGLMKQ